jgi:hypothetical protein
MLAALVPDDERTRQPPRATPDAPSAKETTRYPAVPGTDDIVNRTKFRPVDLL